MTPEEKIRLLRTALSIVIGSDEVKELEAMRDEINNQIEASAINPFAGHTSLVAINALIATA